MVKETLQNTSIKHIADMDKTKDVMGEHKLGAFIYLIRVKEVLSDLRPKTLNQQEEP